MELSDFLDDDMITMKSIYEKAFLRNGTFMLVKENIPDGMGIHVSNIEYDYAIIQLKPNGFDDLGYSGQLIHPFGASYGFRIEKLI
ncbi:hypothetical protein ACFL1H_06360 [Nanoarchaeota archaeon]